MGKKTKSLVQVYNHQDKIEISEIKKDISPALNYLLEQLKKNKDYRFTIVFIDDKQIQKLNQQYRKVNSPTDVLSFPYSSKEADIFISAERAYSQAKEYNQNFEVEIIRLVFHGVLHCLGWKDYSEKEREKMWQLQERILNSFFHINKNC